MKIIKGLNTNVALAIDQTGKEIVVFGKGIGFPKTPYELIDLSKIDRTFYDMDPRYVGMVANLPQSVLLASADIVEQAEFNLDCDLNPNLPFTLADHLNFAIERLQKGIQITTPIAYDVHHLYPLEAELGILALDIVQDYTSIRLPESESTIIAMHIVSSEVESGNLASMLDALQLISEVVRIVEVDLNVKIDKNSYYYSRFVMHVQYLIQRLKQGTPIDDEQGQMLRPMAREYPDIYMCAREISDYFKANKNWECTKEEILYLMLHINRVRMKIEQK